MAVVDVHQHFWPPALVEALSKRSRPPRLHGATLELEGVAPSTVDLAAHALDARLALLDRLEIDVAVVSLQPTLGIGDLPADERDELVAAFEDGMLELAASTVRLVPLAAGPIREGFAGACVAALRARSTSTARRRCWTTSSGGARSSSSIRVRHEPAPERRPGGRRSSTTRQRCRPST